MTLDREDLLTTRIIHKSKPHHPITGYIAYTEKSNTILKIVTFHEGQRYKGYINKTELLKLIQKKQGYAKIHRKPKRR